MDISGSHCSHDRGGHGLLWVFLVLLALALALALDIP